MGCTIIRWLCLVLERDDAWVSKTNMIPKIKNKKEVTEREWKEAEEGGGIIRIASNVGLGF